MSKTVCIDAGHYKNYNKSDVYDKYYEGNMTWIWQKYIKEALEKYGIKVKVTRTCTTTDVPLYDRGAMSKNCDLFISGHSNWCEDKDVDRVVIIHGTNSSTKLANALGSRVSSVMGISSKHQLYTRTKSNGDEWYGVLRGAKAVGTKNRYIIEHSFHSNLKSAKWLYLQDNIKKLAYAEADVIAEYLGVSKPVNDEKVNEPVKTLEKGFYRVVAGSYNDRKTAEDEVEKLKKLGVDAFLLYVQ